MVRSLFLAATLFMAVDAVAQLRFDTLYTRQVGTGAFHSHILEHTQPWNIHVLEIDLEDAYTQIKSIKAGERLTGSETTIDMARRFDYEGHRVVGAVNADFFSAGPISMQIAQGEFVRREASGRPGIGFNYNNDVMVEAPVFISRLILPDQELTVHGVNESRGTNQIVMYNRFYGTSTNTNEHGTEILVESLDGWRANDTLRVVVRGKQADQGSMEITSGMAVLSGHGTSGQAINENVSVGDTLRLALGVQPGIPDLVELVSGGPFLVRNGREDVGPRGDGSDRHPRTAVGINADTTRLYLITIDGRQVQSVGIDLHQLADFMVDIGVHTGINLDGGGSTAMVVRGSIDNRMSEPGEGRRVTNALAVISSAPEGELSDVRLRHDTLKVFRGLAHQFLVDGVDASFHRLPLDSSMVEYSVDPSVGTISEGGYFRSTSEVGSGYVRVRYGDFSDSTYVVLKDVGSLRITPSEIILDTTRAFTFTARAFDTDGARQTIGADEISWTVVDESLGSVSDAGVFRGLAPGRTGVVAHYGVSVTDTAYVTMEVGEGVVMLDALDSVEDWSLSLENVDAAGSRVSVVEDDDGSDVMRLEYRFVQGSATVFRMRMEKEFEIYGIPQAIHVDVKSDGLNHRVFFDVEDQTGARVSFFVPKFINVTDFDSLWAPVTWATMTPPLKLKGMGVQLGNSGVAGAVNEGELLFRNLRISYPQSSSVSVEQGEQPQGFELGQNYPNPFNPTTTIEYALDRPSEVTLRVFNVIGQEVGTLVDTYQSQGAHRVTFDAGALPSGVYFYTLMAGARSTTRSMILLK
jgi:hypothetical protein